MKNKLLALVMAVSIGVGIMPASVVYGASSTTSHTPVTNYLQDTDHIVILPAENWSNVNGKVGERQPLTNTEGWSLTIQNNNSKNGDDLQMWQFGVSDKLRVWDYSKGKGDGVFRLHVVNWREETSNRYIDVEGQKTNDGANIHVWKESGDNKAKWFALEEDNDSDPETFYIYNINSGKYLAPENYFDESKDSWSHRQCLASGKNTVLSSKPYHWRVQVINRTPDTVKSQREWMKQLPDSTLLSEINIPGTHDAATANVEGSWNEGYNAVACQKYFINEQLNVGIRAFDMRMRYKDDGQEEELDKLVMVHGGSNWAVCHYSAFLGKSSSNGENNMSFNSVMTDIEKYLKDHPSETVIITCKADGGDESATAASYKEVMDKYKDILYDWSNTNPTLGDVRGKVVAFSRMSKCSGGYYGPDLSQWDEKYSDSKNKYAQLINSGSPKVYVQDNYSTILNKKTYFYQTVCNLNGDTNEAAPKTNDFVFNYSSYNYASLVVTPLTAARDMNKYILDNSQDLYKNYTSKKKRLGIVMMDYVDETLCRQIYQSNSTSSKNLADYLRLPNTDYIMFSSMGLPIVGLSEEEDKCDTISNVFESDDGKSILTVTLPQISPLVYGSTLKEAVITGGSAVLSIVSEDGSVVKGTVDGQFCFAESDVMPSVSDSDVTEYTLQFIPFDSDKISSVSIKLPVTVIPQPITIEGNDYKIQYGDIIESWKDMVSINGSLAEEDLDKLSGIQMTISGDIEAVVDYDQGMEVNEVITPETPVGSSGTIEISFPQETKSALPNYAFDFINEGTWEVVPRQLTIDWSGVGDYILGETANVTAVIGNIYNDEDVRVVVNGGNETEVGVYTATASLEGADAGNYSIPEELKSVTYTITETTKEVHNPGVTVSPNK